MILTLWSHQWKSFWRSSSAGRGLAIQIFIGFVVLYFLSVGIMLGLNLKVIIEKINPGQDSVKVVSGFLLYYFAFDFIFRFMLQDLPALTIKPYLIQRVKRSELIRFLNIRSLLNIFNLLPLILFFPFVITVIGPRSATAMAAYLIAIGFLTIVNNYLVLYLKRKIVLNNWWLFGLVILCVMIGMADHFNILSLSKLSTFLFSILMRRPWLCIFAVAAAVIVYLNNYYFLLNNLYLEEMEGKQKRRKTANFYFLGKYGLTGELVLLDLKLIWRNKRPRTMIFYSLIFIFYGFFFYNPAVIANPSRWWYLVFGGLFVTGLSVFNYGSFLFAWQSSFFDGLMGSNLPIIIYLKGKWILLSTMSTILFLITTFYGIMDWRIFIIQVACFLYNIGVNVILMIYLATWNYKKMDLSRGSMMNYQASGIIQWLFSSLMIALPIFIYFIFRLLAGGWGGVLAIGIFGLANLFMREWWLRFIVAGFEKRKYLILKGFRES